MNTDEVIDLLTLMASYDRRKVGESDVAAWYAAVSDLPFGDAKDAVIAHYRDSADWIMPVHVRHGVAKIRNDRLRAAGPIIIPEEIADDPLRALEWQKETQAAIADGRPAPAGPAAIEASE